MDANIFISELISKRRDGRSLVEACLDGQFELIYSNHLLDEIEDVINREKFRRWFTVDQGLQLIDAIVLVGTEIKDRPQTDIPQVCEDPDDNYLFALYEDSDANLLVSDDKRVRAVSLPWVTVADRSTANTILDEKHPWGTHLIVGNREEVWKKIEAAGDRDIFGAACLLLETFKDIHSGKYSVNILQALVVPGTADYWIRDFDKIFKMLNGRAFGTHPIVISPDLMGVKLVPDVGEVVMALESPTALQDVLCLTLECCHDVLGEDGKDALKVGGWRAHSVGYRPLTAAEVRPLNNPLRKRAAKKVKKWMPK
uniref:putative toxin-antitoxin system toxin component, PIN family n=1 Tax=Corynebacterium glutamicum TaxID=1718 RepID=UPI00188A8BA1|nr:putative toxin-antitoxin system toxin component, PIN family [Corynebacterium glutamicum]